MISVLREKSGGMIIFVVIMLAFLFPFIMSSMIDLGNIYSISEQMKNSLNASTKSASTIIDWSRVPHGYLEIDPIGARNAFLDVFESNMGLTSLSPRAGYFEGTGSRRSGQVRVHTAIHNQRHLGTFVSFPSLGTIPPNVTTNPTQVDVDRPTVFAVATVDYQLMPLLGGGIVRLTRYASAQLNQINEVESIPPLPTLPTAVIAMTPMSGLLTTTNIAFSRDFSVGNIVLAEWQLNAEAIATTPPSGTLLAGTHTVRLRVQNDTGQWSEWVSTTFNVAGVPIATIAMTPSTGITTATNIVFNDTGSTAGEGTITAREWQRNSDAITATAPSGTFTAGSHTIRLRVQNSAGTWSAWASRSFSITAISPVASIGLTPSTGITTATNIIFNDTSSTAGEGTITAREWQRNSDAITTAPPNGMFPLGNHIIRLRVQNSSGTWSAWTSRSFSVAGIPIANITMAPATGITPTTTVTFSDTTSTPGEGTITAREWQRNSDAITATAPSGTFTAGSHTIRLRVQNSTGTWSAWTSTTFSVTAAGPVVSINIQVILYGGFHYLIFTPTTLVVGSGPTTAFEWELNGIYSSTPPDGWWSGEIRVRLRGRDSAGNWGSWVTRTHIAP